MRVALAAVRVVVVVVSVTGASRAGDLTPPAGPVGTTMKDLSTVEPRIPVGPDTTPGDASAVYILPGPGAYYLTANVVGQTGKNGIVMHGSTTLDLNGFSIIGVAGASEGVYAIGSGIGIKNGVISGWGGRGLDFYFATDSSVDNIQAEGNTGTGIYVGNGSVVRDCRAHQCGGGFATNGRAVFERCTANTNNGAGFSIVGNLVNCVAGFNTSYGFQCSGGVLSECYALGNSGIGFRLFESTATNCQSTQNSDGFSIEESCVLSSCSARLNTTDGFHIVDGSVLDHCNAKQNGDDGFQLTGGSEVTACVSRSNHYGFYVAGVGGAVRIDSCVAANNENFGYLNNTNGALVVRNQAYNNGTDYSLTSGAQNGTIIVGAGTITSTNPWANFGTTSVALDASSLPADVARKEREALAEAAQRRPIGPQAAPEQLQNGATR